MRILLGNSVSVTAEMEMQCAIPLEFEESVPFQFSVPPPTPTQEPVSLTATGSLLPSRRAEDRFPGADGTAPISAFSKEPAGHVAAGSSSAPSFGEFNEPAASEWDDFAGPADTHALSDWPL
jgi:hypothetical protein